MQVEKMRAFIIRFVFCCIFILLVFIAFRYVLPVLMPFIIGFFFALVLQPIINKATAKNPKHHKWIAIGTMIAFYLVLIALFTVLGSRIVLLVQQLFYYLPTFFAESIEPALLLFQNTIEGVLLAFNPTLMSGFESWGDSLVSSLSSFVSTISSGALSLAGSFAASVPTLFVKLIITIITSFFCVVDYRLIVDFLMRQLPSGGKNMMSHIKNKGINVIASLARAYFMLMSLTCAELFVGFLLLRVPNALLLALVIALVDILPVLGTGTVLIPWGLYQILVGNYPLGIALLILYLIITVVRQSLEPRIIGNQIGLYPLATLLCMFIGTALFGAVGLFGLPILATILVQLNESGDIKLFK